MHWHRSHLHDLSQRSLCILLQWEGASITLSVLARLLHKSSEVTRLAMRPWHEQGIVTMDSSKQGADPVYSLNFRRFTPSTQRTPGALRTRGLGELYSPTDRTCTARLEARVFRPVVAGSARGYVLGFPRRMGWRGRGGHAPEGERRVSIHLFSDEQFAILDRYGLHRTSAPLTVAVGPSREQPIVPVVGDYLRSRA